jgi:putative RecB family exonuclease
LLPSLPIPGIRAHLRRNFTSLAYTAPPFEESVPPIYSHSRLSSFENCPKQFHFRYVLKIESETEGIEAFVGKRVHEILERLHEFVDRGLLPSVQRVIDRYHALWQEQYDPGRVRVAREGTPVEHYLQLGIRCIENYYRSRYPFDAEETLGLEQRVLFSLDPGGKYKLQGVIDRVARATDGVVEIHDYKTGARVPSQKTLDSDRQLALYQIGLTQELGSSERFRLVWHYVAAGVTRSSERAPEQLERLQDDTMRLIDRIGAERDYAPRKSSLCGWCEYKAICPAWGGPEIPVQRELAIAAADDES